MRIQKKSGDFLYDVNDGSPTCFSATTKADRRRCDYKELFFKHVTLITSTLLATVAQIIVKSERKLVVVYKGVFN